MNDSSVSESCSRGNRSRELRGHPIANLRSIVLYNKNYMNYNGKLYCKPLVESH